MMVNERWLHVLYYLEPKRLVCNIICVETASVFLWTHGHAVLIHVMNYLHFAEIKSKLQKLSQYIATCIKMAVFKYEMLQYK